MPIPEFSFIHPIRRLLQAYLPLEKKIGYFWLKLTNQTATGHFAVPGTAK
jgi:hypothetical protein